MFCNGRRSSIKLFFAPHNHPWVLPELFFAALIQYLCIKTIFYSNQFTIWIPKIVSLCSTEAKVTTLECRSKIHMPFERGPYSDIKKQNIFQIYREKFWNIFKENLGRVPPCPSTWHKHEWKRNEILKMEPFTDLLHFSVFFLIRMNIELKYFSSKIRLDSYKV